MKLGGVLRPKNGGHLVQAAEAGKPEAFVPLQDGRNIPISIESKNGGYSASVDLPGGGSIPAKLDSPIPMANGGVVGGSSINNANTTNNISIYCKHFVILPNEYH